MCIKRSDLRRQERTIYPLLLWKEYYMQNNSSNNNRIAKNTFLLYIRTILVVLVALYTSRVVLDVLGVDDFGVYNVVGGVVAMFSIVSGALSTSISRYITYELGTGNKESLRSVFSTSVIVQFCIACIVLILCELLGVWFLNNKLIIPNGRMFAATWVLHCSLLAFVINLISVPYNATIIAHERMDAFAYISVFEVVLKLGIVYALIISPFDKLITYSVLTVSVALIIRFTYGVYCKRQFEECRGRVVYDKRFFKEMLGFASWNFISNGVYVFNTQGVNMLVNMFFGVALNAARGLATQVESAVATFVNNFTTAINPQITKSYASGDLDRMYYLVCKGAKFSYLLLFVFSLPFLFETEFILNVWLKQVPQYAALFTRLAFVQAMAGVLGNTCYTACLATGRIKKYTLKVSLVAVLVFGCTWLCYELGMPVETVYYVYTVDWLILLIVKLYQTKQLTGLKPSKFFKEVVVPILVVTIMSLMPPFLICNFMEPSFERFIVSTIVAVFFSSIIVYVVGLTAGERTTVISKFKNITSNAIKKIHK